MTKQDYINTLSQLAAGSKIASNGKIFTVLAINFQDTNSKLCRTDIAMLEDGKPETYETAGLFLNAGKVITMSNIEHRTLYAQAASFKNLQVL